MIHEIYNKLPKESNYRMAVETVDEIEYIVQQIRMVLGTTPGEVLGSPLFGIDLEQYLFNYNYNQKEIHDLILYNLTMNIYYDSEKYSVDIDVKFGQNVTDMTDYALIDIKVNELKYLGVLVTK